MNVKNYRDLEVSQKAMGLVVDCYRIASPVPEGRSLRSGESASASGGLGASEHCRRSGAQPYQGIPPPSLNCVRLADGS